MASRSAAALPVESRPLALDEAALNGRNRDAGRGDDDDDADAATAAAGFGGTAAGCNDSSAAPFLGGRCMVAMARRGRLVTSS